MSDGDTPTEDALRASRRGQLVGLAFLLAVVVVAVVIGSGALSGDDPAKKGSLVDGVRGTRETTALLRGVPQNGMVLGRPDAPVTIVEFLDVKCPFCKNFALEDGPDVVKDLIRTGKANMELRVLDNLGESSGAGQAAVYNAAARNQAWTLSELLFWNQKSESEEWLTPGLLRSIGTTAPELRGVPLSTTPTPEAKRLIAETSSLSGKLDAKKTPTFFVRPRGSTDTGAYRKVGINGTGSKAGKLADAVRDLGT